METDDLDVLLTFKGVGRKTANLVLTEGFGKLGVCVDTHVHRISNRLGLIKTKTLLICMAMLFPFLNFTISKYHAYY